MKQNTNVDLQEIEKFSSYAQVWWDPTGPFAPLHAINPPRLEFIKKHSKLEGKTILDVGCGAGILTESLYADGAKAYGIDASKKVLNVAIERAKVNDLTIDYSHNTIEEYLNSYKQQFDIITCMELIEHVPSPLQLLKDCASILKPGGQFFLSTINRTPKAYLYAILGAEYVLNILPKHTHQYKKFIKPAEMQQLMQQAGLQLEDLSGMNYNPFTKHAKLSTDTNINYLAYAIKG